MNMRAALSVIQKTPVRASHQSVHSKKTEHRTIRFPHPYVHKDAEKPKIPMLACLPGRLPKKKFTHPSEVEETTPIFH